MVLFFSCRCCYCSIVGASQSWCMLLMLVFSSSLLLFCVNILLLLLQTVLRCETATVTVWSCFFVYLCIWLVRCCRSKSFCGENQTHVYATINTIFSACRRCQSFRHGTTETFFFSFRFIYFFNLTFFFFVNTNHFALFRSHTHSLVFVDFSVLLFITFWLLFRKCLQTQHTFITWKLFLSFFLLCLENVSSIICLTNYDC